MSRADTAWDGEVGWAVWVGNRRDRQCVAVLAETQDAAERKALEESDADEVFTVDGPFQNAEPGVWEFEFITQHRERVVVEAPTRSYAEESADAERDYDGQLIETVHTEARKVGTKDCDDTDG